MNILITLFILSLIPYLVLSFCFINRKNFNYRLVMGGKEISINVDHWGVEPVSDELYEMPDPMPDPQDELADSESPVVSPHIAERNRLYDAKMKALQEEIDLYKESRLPEGMYQADGTDIDERIAIKPPEHEYAR